MSSWTYLVVLLGSALLTSVCVAFSIRLANRHGIHDHPDAERKMQDRPIPKLGGLAVAIAFTVSALAALLVIRPSAILLGMSLLVPALLAALVGYVDDLRHLNPRLRLGLQAALGALAWALGARIVAFDTPWLDFPLTVLWFMIIVNGINLLDNSDGLAGSTVMVSALGASVIALVFGQELVSLLGFALVGACIGYLRHNWHPASVYMGDSGAYFLGFLLAGLIIRLRPETVSPVAGVLIAVLLALLPIVDTSYVVIKRLRAGIHPFTAGRDHLAHVLQDRGHSVPSSVLVLQSALVLSTLVAVGISGMVIS